MENIENKEIFFNRAEAVEAEKMHCENCFEEAVFLLKDKDHEFSMGLTTVLQCLEFAVRNGCLPKLPNSWVGAVERFYNVEFDGSTQYSDYEFQKRKAEK